MDLKRELVLIPVSDVDREPNDEFRVVQMTPPGSACSPTLGKGIVSVTETARAELVERGVEVSEVRHVTPGGWVPGPDPEHRDYNSFADSSDTHGNSWMQAVRVGKREE